MVALKQARPSTRSAATFSLQCRENPPHSRRFGQHFSQSLQRARYYDPSTGEFTSRDPLEYVDGMSIYRQGIAQRDVDPTGMVTTVQDDPVVFGLERNPCTDSAGVKWGWKLDRPSSVRGYIIQRVEFTCKWCPCGTCGECLPFGCETSGPHVYYEAWLVNGTKEAPTDRPVRVEDAEKDFDDFHRTKGVQGRCQFEIRTLSARFYRLRFGRIENQTGWVDGDPPVTYGLHGCRLTPGPLPSHGPGARQWDDAARAGRNMGERQVDINLKLDTTCCGSGQDGGTFAYD